MYWFYNDYYIVYFIIFFNKYNFKNVYNNGLMPYLRKQLQKLQTMTEYIFCHALNSSN